MQSIWLILKSKDQLSISDNSDGSSMSVFSSTIFQKLPKTLFLGVSTPFFFKKSRRWKIFKPRFVFSENTWSHLICSKKKVQICKSVLCMYYNGLKCCFKWDLFKVGSLYIPYISYLRIRCPYCSINTALYCSWIQWLNGFELSA